MASAEAQREGPGRGNAASAPAMTAAMLAGEGLCGLQWSVRELLEGLGGCEGGRRVVLRGEVRGDGEASPAPAMVRATERRLGELWWGTCGALVGSGGSREALKGGSRR